MSGLYPPDLAQIHAEGYTDTFQPGFDWLAETVLSGPTPAKLFDIGCGDGSWLAIARQKGISGAGVDLSPAFVELAQERGVPVTQGAAADSAIPTGTTAITALGEVLSYLDTATGTDSLDAVAHAALEALPKGGRLIADLIGRAVIPFSGQRTGSNWQIRSETTVMSDRIERRIETHFDERVDTVTHRQSRREPTATADALKALGWQCDIAESYGPCPLLPGRFAVILTKP